MTLSSDELRRYARHLILPEVGLAGQQKIRASRVICIGTGGLGSPAALYLAAAGVGQLGLVDFDQVDLSNLQRQVLHGTPDIGRSKTESAIDAIRRLNPEVEVRAYPVRLDRDNALAILRDYDVIVDGTDNFATRYLTNDACVLLGKPNIYGSIHRFEGQASVFAPHQGGPCYRCLYPEPPPPGTVPSCAEGGVLGVLPGLVGCIQATETLKWILGRGTSLLGRLLLVNALEMRFREVKLRRDPACPICGRQPTIRELVNYEAFCGQAPGVHQSPESNPDEVSVRDLERVLNDPERRVRVIDVREPHEHAIARIEGIPLIPMGELPERAVEWDRQVPHYLICHLGVRSLHAVHYLKRQGFTAVKSVRGGIRAWSNEIDSSVPDY